MSSMIFRGMFLYSGDSLAKSEIKSILEGVIRIGGKYDRKWGCFNAKTGGFEEDADFSRAVEIIADFGGSLKVEYESKTFNISFYIERHIKEFSISYEVDYLYFEDNKEKFVTTEKFLMQLWDISPVKPEYGCADVFHESSCPLGDIGIAGGIKPFPHVIPPEYWMNFYGSGLVKKIGKEKLLSAPITVKEISGGICLIAGEKPGIYTDFRMLQEHFGWRCYTLNVTDYIYSGKEKFQTLSQAKTFLEKEIVNLRREKQGIKVGVTIFVAAGGESGNEKYMKPAKELEDWLLKTLKIDRVKVI